MFCRLLIEVMKMFYGINGPVRRVVDTRSERDEVLREHGGIARSFFMRSNAEFFSENGITAQEGRLIETADAATVVYTHGACSASERGTFAGAGVWFGHDSEDNVSMVVEPHDGVLPTNQRAELVAVLQAMLVARKRDCRVLEIHTRSKYCIGLLRDVELHYYHQFLDSKGMPMVNGDVLREIYGVMTGDDVAPVLRHVHAGNEGNEAADRLAVQARDLAERRASGTSR